MGGYYLLVILISLSAAFAYINHRFIRMPFVIGLFFLSIVLSLGILTSELWDFQYYDKIKDTIEQIDISKIILNIMLGFLLFSGSLHTQWSGIRQQIKPIGLFAFGGVFLSTLIIGGLFYFLCQLIGTPVGFIYALIFGALISPTDPIAVLGILTKAGVSPKIESTIVGESLFNDGVGVVVFIALLETLKLGFEKMDFGHFSLLFLQEALGGIFFGLVLGFVLFRLLKSIDNYGTEVLLTIAFVMAGFALCNFLNLSGALAMVIMGLFVGNYKQEKSMSDVTMEYINKFWELVDVILNAILFLGIALVIVVIDFKASRLFIGCLSILILLFSRVVVVYLPNLIFPKFTNINRQEAKLIVWGGLRGGLSLALALSLPKGDEQQLIVIVTYICVVFSMLVQGLTIERLARKIRNSPSTN